jgi:hypothetical protein
MKRSPLTSMSTAALLALATGACSHAGMTVSSTSGDENTLPDAAADAPAAEAGLRVDVIDDFEDGDLDISVAGGRLGHWYNYDDMTDGMNHIAVVTLDPTTERHTTLAGESKMAMRVQATGYTRWGSGFSADIAGAAVYDVSAYTGLVFWTKNLTDAPVSIKIALQDVNSDPRGGKCDPSPDAGTDTACYDAFAQNVTLLPGDWQIHLLPFWSLHQQGFGLKVPTGLATHEVYALPVADSFGATYDYLLDDIGFYVE